MKPSSTRKGIFLALFILLLTYLFIYYEFYFLIMEPKRAIEFTNSFHPYDFVFIVFQISQVLIAGAIPGEISEFAGGYNYGPGLGRIYSAFGLSIGSWLAFILARIYGLPFVRWIVGPSIMGKHDYFMEHQGRLTPFILFMIPGFPKAALCYIVGLSHMRTFIAVSTSGRLLGIILVTICGSPLKNHQDMIFLILLISMSIIFLLGYLYRDRLKKMTERRKSVE